MPINFTSTFLDLNCDFSEYRFFITTLCRISIAHLQISYFIDRVIVNEDFLNFSKDDLPQCVQIE